MSRGSPAAATWLATHFYKEYPGLLAEQAAKGEPQAMSFAGVIAIHNGDKAKGAAPVHGAALKGNARAIEYELDGRV